MSDLIDLKSPDGKTLSGTKLASPLIPVPSDTPTSDKDPSSLASPSSSFDIKKRTSLDNNPFDNAHHKTVEYVRKQEDPFEVVLEKALTYEQRKLKAAGSKARYLDSKDDFTPKKKKYSEILKMNKTLDDSATCLELNAIAMPRKPSLSSAVAESEMLVSRDAIRTDNPNNHLHAGSTIPRLCVESVNLDSSILNQSAMNDSLTESSGSIDDSLLRSVVGLRINEGIRRASRDQSFLVRNKEIPKLHNLRRSLSQGDKMSPKKFKAQRSRSIVDSLKVGTRDYDSSYSLATPSILFDDSMNKAFLRSFSRTDISSLSNISSISRITRATSLSGSSNSSSVYSNRTANCAFIENSKSCGTGHSEELGDGKFLPAGTIGPNCLSMSMAQNLADEAHKDRHLSDLIQKYTELRTKSESASNDASLRTRDVIRRTALSETIVSPRNTEGKLIDVDIFIPESKESPGSFQRKSISSSSSDSVFVDSDTIEKSIFSEAKTLAKTFQELASKSSSSSISSNDLVNSIPRWNFEVLPPSDDEALVSDLIDLPKSPAKSNSESSNCPEENQRSASVLGANSESSADKDLDVEFRDPENKAIASTLLLDLEKLVKSEANAEAAALLKSLEKALGINCESNVDLLTTCLAARNCPRNSPRRSENINGNEETKDESVGKSWEGKNEGDRLKTIKQSCLTNKKRLQNNFNSQEIDENDKSSVLVNNIYDGLSMEYGGKNLSEESSEKIHENSIEALSHRNHITDDQKIAVEILVGLGKLFSGQNKEIPAATLLKKLGDALNLATARDCDQNTSVEEVVKETKCVVTPVKNRIATPPRKPVALSVFSRTPNRRSLDSHKAKSSNDRVLRRSMSVSQTPTSTTPNTSRLPKAPLSADKSKAYLRDGRKRFPSDPSSDLQQSNVRKLNKDIPLKPVAVAELARQEKPSSTVVSVKNRFKKKIEPVLTSKKGPMKAILPLGNMQRRGTSASKHSPLNGSVTPPKSIRETPSPFAVTTSTPFPVVHLTIPPKKSSKTKPVASSTPDDVGTKHLRRSASQIPQSPGRSAFSCNISPVTSKRDEVNDENPGQNNPMSAKGSRISTPSKCRQTSQLPKLSPMLTSKNASPKLNRGHRRSEPLQSFLPKSSARPESPAERRGSDGAVSPLNSSNKFGSAVKPLNLISKLGRRKTSVAEKENYA